MLIPGIITDEISQDLKKASRAARSWSLKTVDLRSVWEKSPFELTSDDFRKIQRILAKNDLAVSAIDSPLFKCGFDDNDAILSQLNSLYRLADGMELLSCRMFRAFDFLKDAHSSAADRAERFAPVIRLCRERGFICLLENDPSVNSDTPAKLRELLDIINDSHIRAVFDPGNGWYADPDTVAYPNDYKILKPYINHVHIKDVRMTGHGAEAVCIGTGLVGYPFLLRALYADGYDGAIILETHYRKNMTLPDALLKNPRGKRFSDGGFDASMESAAALISILNTIYQG